MMGDTRREDSTMRSTWSILAVWNTDEFAERPDVLVALLDVVQAAERLTTDAGYAYSTPAEVPQTFLVAVENTLESLRDAATANDAGPRVPTREGDGVNRIETLTGRLRRWWQNRTATAVMREIERDPYFGRDYARPKRRSRR